MSHINIIKLSTAAALVWVAFLDPAYSAGPSRYYTICNHDCQVELDKALRLCPFDNQTKQDIQTCEDKAWEVFTDCDGKCYDKWWKK